MGYVALNTVNKKMPNFRNIKPKKKKKNYKSISFLNG
jgi:hypothetical protein